MKRSLLIFLLFSFVGPWAFAQDTGFRNWTSANGKFSVEAKLVEKNNDSVRLRRKNNGKVITVAIAKLSAEDKKFLETVGSKSNWGKWIDPDGKSKHEIKDGALRMSLPGGKFVLDAETRILNAPRVEQTIDAEEFVLDVTVDGDFQPKIGGQNEYRGAGVFVIVDDRSFLRLERASYSGNHYVNFEKRENGRALRFGQFDESQVNPSKPISLRLIVTKSEAIAGYKQDGDWEFLRRTETWTPIMLVEDHPDDGIVEQRIGVASSTTSKSPFSPTYSKFQLYTDLTFVQDALKQAGH